MSPQPEIWHLVIGKSVLRIHDEVSPGRPTGVPLAIGSTPLAFRAPRTGAKRGESMVYRSFVEEDLRRARMIAAAPELLAALEDVLRHAALSLSGTTEEEQPCAEIPSSVIYGLGTLVARVKKGTP